MTIKFNEKDFKQKLLEPYNYYVDVKNTCEALIARPELVSASEIQAMKEFLNNFDSSQTNYAKFLAKVFDEKPEVVYEKHLKATLFNFGLFKSKKEFVVDEEAANLYKEAYSPVMTEIDKLLLAFSVTEEELQGLKKSKADGITDIIRGYAERTKDGNKLQLLYPCAEVIRRLSYGIFSIKDLLHFQQKMGMNIDRFVDNFFNFIQKSGVILEAYADLMSYNTGFDITSKEELEKQNFDSNNKAAMFYAATSYNDYYNALRSINKLADFFASVMGYTKDEMLDIINNDEKEELLTKGKVVSFELTDEDVLWTPKFMYDRVFDSWTYINDLYDTVNKTGLPIKGLLEQYSGLTLPEKIFYYNKIAEQLPQDEEKFKPAIAFIKAMSMHTYWTEQALDTLDIAYGLEHNTIFNAVGNYKEEVMSKIKNIKFEVVESL